MGLKLCNRTSYKTQYIHWTTANYISLQRRTISNETNVPIYNLNESVGSFEYKRIIEVLTHTTGFFWIKITTEWRPVII